MSSRRIVLFAIAFILLIVVIINPFPKRQTGLDSEITPIPVMVAARDIPPFTILTEADVRSERLSPDQALNSFGGKLGLVGMMTTTELRSGNVVRRSGVLVPDPQWVEGEMLIFSFYVPTARIVGGQLRPGHHVDLLVTRAETRDQLPETLWLSENLWVVGVYQASGDDVLRPTVSVQSETPEASVATGAFAFASSSAMNARQGPANLVVVAAHRETARMIGDYVGARLYEPWVYVRPGEMSLESVASMGRIDGLVFDDLSTDQIRQRSEPGIDGVTVNLVTENAELISSVKTVSGGAFFFDDLEPDVYIVEQTDLAGYESVSPNRVRLVVVAGQNLHVQFADVRPAVESNGNVVTTSVAPQPTQAIRPTVTATEEAQVIQPGEGTCSCTAYMSDVQGGKEVSNFGSPSSRVWAVVDLKDCPADTPFSIFVRRGASTEPERLAGGGIWKGGTSPTSVPVEPWHGDAFEPGAYVTYVKVGIDETVCGMALWYVDVAHSQSAGAETTPLPDKLPDKLPVTGDVADDAPPDQPSTGFGFGRGR